MGDKRYKWKTKNGEVLFVDEMTDSHLINSRNFLVKKRLELAENISAAYGMSCMLTGEYALDSIDRDITWLEEMENKISTTLAILDEEMKKRNLKGGDTP